MTVPPEDFECPVRPDLRCMDHGCVMELLHSYVGRLMVLESRVAYLEDREGVRNE